MGEEVRPWGHYEILSESSDYKVKRIVVNSGARFSYQRHQHRSEHWFIVSGSAKVTHNGLEFEMSAGDSIDIAQGAGFFSIISEKRPRKLSTSTSVEISLHAFT